MHTKYPGLVPLHRAAVEASVGAVASVAAADLDRPTPCVGWTLHDLLAHMTVQHRGFAAAARGLGAESTRWDVDTVVDPLADYAAAARDAVDAFAEADAETRFALPEFGVGVVVSGEVAIGFHLVDYVVHGWDVAATLGRSFAIPDDVAAAALTVALAVPDNEFRDAPGAPFAHAVDGASGSDLDRVLRHLGRDPQWTLSRTPR